MFWSASRNDSHAGELSLQGICLYFKNIQSFFKVEISKKNAVSQMMCAESEEINYKMKQADVSQGLSFSLEG